ncbi:hypothetical protein [Streptomyces sp. NBC_01264]|uniref:hypothetical protein n=1 Tax=Streptomyces sp. NBC_01264 TaxID=2903804 RepID=UPI00224EE7BB|nr:hypothetical protein [Streptomyces sp. NBC_01264]MCX4778044.1 hypothetical protein [Streptomyces sp. NBC_01264]
MNRRIWQPVALAAAAMALTASCDLAAGIYAADITADRLEGRWTDGGTASLTFRADHTFSSESLDKYPVTSKCGNPEDLTSGTWAFWAPIEPGGTSFTVEETATRGTMLSLKFDGRRCSVDVYLYGDDADPAMCPAPDADEGCADTGYLQRSDEDG